MLYLANPVSTAVLDHMRAGTLGLIDGPGQGKHGPVELALEAGVVWAADNGCFTDAWRQGKWWEWLVRRSPYAATCLFAVAPDVVGDALATLVRSGPWFKGIRRLGYRVAYVAQDGTEDIGVPWDYLDVLFIGGTTEWKLGAYVRDELIPEARARGVWVHVGRVNSERRWRYFTALGVDSCDGTFLTRGPDKNLRRVEAWLRGDHQLALGE